MSKPLSFLLITTYVARLNVLSKNYLSLVKLCYNECMKLAVKILVLFLLLQFVFVWGSPFIFGDGYGYYHVGHSLIYNQTFVQSQSPEYLENASHAVSEFNGNYVTVYSVGNSILWIPFLLVSSLFSSGSIYTDYFKAFNGHSFADGFSILIAALFYAYLSLFFLIKYIQNLGFSKRISYFSVAAVYLSTYALSYVLTNASYSHTYEIFAVSGLLFSLTQYSKKFEKKWMILAGVFASLSVLTRSLNILIVIPVSVYIFMYQSRKAFVAYIASSIPFALIFLIYNYISYGKFLASGYSEVWGANLSIHEFNLLQLLFSDVRGWFVWSPVVVIALIGLFLYAKRSKQSVILNILPVVLTVLVYSFWENWWAGDSIGQRFFLSLTPFLVLGLAYFTKVLSKYPRIVKYSLYSLIVILVFYSFSIFVLHRFSPTQSLGIERKRYSEVTATEKFTTFDIYKYHYNLAMDSTSVTDYVDNLSSALQGGRSLALLYFGQSQPILTLDTSDNTIRLLNTPYQKDYLFSIILQLTHDDQIIQTFSLTEVSSKENLQLTYECSEFIKDYCKFTSSNVSILNLGEAEVELLNPALVQDKDDDLSFSIYLSEDIEVVD